MGIAGRVEDLGVCRFSISKVDDIEAFDYQFSSELYLLLRDLRSLVVG